MACGFGLVFGFSTYFGCFRFVFELNCLLVIVICFVCLSLLFSVFVNCRVVLVCWVFDFCGCA